MSKFMLNDEDAINDVNPFVTQDFSLPGSVRQSGGFDNFSNVSTSEGIPDASESVYCSIGSCETQTKPTDVFGAIHPRRNIDTGFVCDTPEKMKVGVATQVQIPYFGLFLIVVIIALVLLLARR
jgi:hypothetical protein